jgi:hypothetical protein
MACYHYTLLCQPVQSQLQLARFLGTLGPLLCYNPFNLLLGAITVDPVCEGGGLF